MRGSFDRLAPRIFAASLVVLVFVYGMAAGIYRLFPYQIYVSAQQGYEEFCKRYQVGSIGNKLPGHMWQLRQEPYPPAIINTSQAYKGLNLVNQVETGGVIKPTGEALIIKIIDMDGNALHQWTVDWFKLWPDARHVPGEILPQSPPGTHVDAQTIVDHGDLVITFTGIGLMRLDRQGKVVWRLPYLTHHSITPDDDGNLWVCGRRRRTEWTERLPNQLAPFNEETLLEVSPQGRILHEWSVEDILIKNGLRGLLHLGTLADKSTQVPPKADILHLNKVELFPAKRFREGIFKKGDLVVSLRNLNTVFVFNRETERIRFISTGNFVRQHDPVFIDGNTFSVFDNNVAFPPQCTLRSRIAIVSALDGTVKTYYQGTRERPFYTVVCGKHRWLPNGNVLIIEACRGRAFEVNPQGEIVWQYLNYIDKQKGVVGLIEDVQRLPLDYARFYTGSGSDGAKSPTFAAAANSAAAGPATTKTSGEGELKP